MCDTPYNLTLCKVRRNGRYPTHLPDLASTSNLCERWTALVHDLQHFPGRDLDDFFPSHSRGRKINVDCLESGNLR